MNIDNSALTKLNCDFAFWMTVVQGKRRDEFSPALAKGNAYHYAMEMIARRNATLGEVSMIVQEACNKYNAYQFLPVVLASVMQTLALKLPPPLLRPDGTPMVEVKFSEEFELDGQILNIQGTIDRICINQGKVQFIDYKTTSNFRVDSLGAKYAASSQLRFYRWALKKWGHKYLPSDAYELLCQGEYFMNYLIVPLIPNMNPTWTQPFGALEFDIEIAEQAIKAQLRRAIELYQETEEPARTGMFHGACTNCELNILCQTNTRGQYYELLDRIPTSGYSPLNFRD